MQEQKNLALFRKQQLRETKILLREEQKECAELMAKLKQEREQAVSTTDRQTDRQTRAQREIERERERERERPRSCCERNRRSVRS
jgi:hypothetical protein